MKVEFSKIFEEWLAGLAITRAHDFVTREDFAFCGTNFIPEELRSKYQQFCAAWAQRFGPKDTLQGITQPGWYNLRAKACGGVYKTYPDRLRTCVNVWVPEQLAYIRRHWEATFPGKGDEAPVVARVHIDPGFGPWIAELTIPMSSKAWGVVHCYNGNSWWVLKEYNGGFCIGITGPASLPFQRALRLVECHHQSGWYNNTAVYLEWIFAAGDENVFRAADDALSGRPTETIASARRKVRAAIA